ncbi:cyanophycin synthetase [Rubricoccus marinus]|uniref:Cyanophycin synthetase n=1 Tax=Rubricoccus marinus TaxID=716817 RepID=A0A259TVN8_9BACT|nr:cyanophycin synthetase [Rubricoccus marinus]OZC01829.1 cyanophycin synthetase [Rubricoccus marinus]
MRILSTNVYVGPNVYARFPVIRHVIDLGPLENYPTGTLGDFPARLVEALPGLQEHGCSYREPGGFIRRMTEDEGTWLGHVWEHVALELQGIAGSDVTFGKTRSRRGEPGCYDMVYSYHQREVGLEAGKLARRLILQLLPPEVQAEIDEEKEDWDWDEERDDFIRFAQRREFGPSTQSIVDAAVARGIPWLRLNKYSLVQFGHGKYQKRIQATVTSETKHISVELASDKDETHSLLGDLGLPVPKQTLCYSVRDAIRAAEKTGYPVVVKPLNANHGRGVSIRLMTPEAVETGFHVASEHGTSRGVLVESFVEGFDHRMLVVGGKLIAVAKRVPGHVVGDGTHTIEELVEIVNADPRRGVGHEKVLTQLQFDEQAERLMEKRGVTKETVLASGETLFLRETANLSTGGTAIDLTDVVHPDNRDMAERAIKAIGLDVGGVDFLSTDITKSWRDIGGGIVECNAAPGFRMHVAPSEGTPRNVAEPVIDLLFPPGTPARIPIAAITGTNGKTTTTRMLAHIAQMAGYTPGMTTSDGVYINGRMSVKGDMTGPTSSNMVLRDPDVDCAILETARGGMVRSGLAFNECDVAACLNVRADHLGIRGIDTLDQLAEIKKIPIDVAKDCAVLNADDERCLAMAADSRAESICYVTMDPQHAIVREHVRAGGRAVVLEPGMNGDMITIYDGGRHIPLLWTHLIPATMEGKATHNVQNAMFAAGMAYALGENAMEKINLDHIRHGLRTFSTSYYEAPGRLNVFDEHPFKVILDYAHNPDAVGMMVELAGKLDVRGKRRLVLAAPGDRRDEDIREIATIAAGHFDHYVCKRDDNPRGRDEREVPLMLQKALLDAGVAPEAVDIVVDEQEAIEHALASGEENDLILIFGDDISRSWKQIIYFGQASGDGEDETAPPTPVTAPMLAPEASGGMIAAPATASAKPAKGPITRRDADMDAVDLPDGQRLVRDERGVRIVLDEEAD